MSGRRSHRNFGQLMRLTNAEFARYYMNGVAGQMRRESVPVTGGRYMKQQVTALRSCGRTSFLGAVSGLYSYPVGRERISRQMTEEPTAVQGRLALFVDGKGT
jgi:hypothetical protein